MLLTIGCCPPWTLPESLTPGAVVVGGGVVVGAGTTGESHTKDEQKESTKMHGDSWIWAGIFGDACTFSLSPQSQAQVTLDGRERSTLRYTLN